MRNRIYALRTVGVIALAIGMSGMVTSATAAPDLSHCTDNSRECLVASAMSYINGLTLSAPAASMRLSPHIRRTIESAGFPDGFSETIGAAAMRAGLSPQEPTDPEIKKYLAEHKMTFEEFLAESAREKETKKYTIELIVIDERAGQVVIVWGGATPPDPGKSMERFKIVKGLITEIESLDVDRKFTDGTLGWPAVQPCLKSGDGHLIPCDK